MTIPTSDLSVTMPPQKRLQARYGADIGFVPPEWNETLDLLLAHRTVRHYLPRKVPEGVLELLVAAAQSASSSSNLQAWSVIAVEDAERKVRLAGFSGNNPHINAAPLLLVWLIDLKRLRDIAVSQGHEGEGLDYLESFLVGAIDAALAAQNAVVAAESLGLGTCYIGGMRNEPENVAHELGLPAGVVAVFGMTVGYPDPVVGTDVKPRLPQSAVLFREHYGQVSWADLDAYDARMKKFQAGQNMPQNGWQSVLARRVASGEVLKERARLGEILRRMGFPLR
ncbi:NADPH-dependent oxidoreductase [Daeguia caeni]|uniref:NADPH-dependent oxidoreductase n=1 Tax=Daeguia caeni TaxID=439612 RepID=A0ABV9H9A5_9HYPH